MDLPARAATPQGSQEPHGTPDLHIPQRKATLGDGGGGGSPTHQCRNPTCLEPCLVEEPSFRPRSPSSAACAKTRHFTPRELPRGPHPRTVSHRPALERNWFLLTHHLPRPGLLVPGDLEAQAERCGVGCPWSPWGLCSSLGYCICSLHRAYEVSLDIL